MAFTFIWGTGFEMGQVPLQAGVCVSHGPVTVDTASPKTGTYSVRMGSSFNGGDITITLNSLSTLSFGVWCKKYRSDGPFEIHITLVNDDVVKFICDYDLETWKYQVGVTVVATGTININTLEFHHVQAVFSAGAVEQKINGVTSINYGTGLVAAIKSIKFYGYGGNAGAGGTYDDIIIGEGTSFTGDIRFDVLKPDGDTATVNWMPNGFSLQAAPAAPTVGLSAGPGLTGDYHYKVTLVDTDGETLVGTASALVQPSNQTVNLTNIPTGETGTTARKIYRTTNGGSTYKLLTTINDNTTTTHNDTAADGTLGAERSAKVNYDKINETPASDSDFIHTSTSGVQDIHTLQDWDSTKKTPLYVIHWARAVKNTADSQQIKLLQKSLGTLRTGSAHDLATSAAYIFDMLTLDPAGNAWTDAAIDDLQSGAEAVIP